IPKIDDILKKIKFDESTCLAYGAAKKQDKACTGNNECSRLNVNNAYYCDLGTGCCETSDFTNLPGTLKTDSSLAIKIGDGISPIFYGSTPKPTASRPSALPVVILGNNGQQYEVTVTLPGTTQKKLFASTLGKSGEKDDEVKLCLTIGSLSGEAHQSTALNGLSSAALFEADRGSDGRLIPPTTAGPGVEIHKEFSLYNEDFSAGVPATSENLKCFYDAKSKKGPRVNSAFTVELSFANGQNSELKSGLGISSGFCYSVDEKVDFDRVCSAALGEALTVAGPLECPSQCPIKQLYYEKDTISNVFGRLCSPIKESGIYSDKIVGAYMTCLESVYVRCMPDFSKKPCDITVSDAWNRKVDVDVTNKTTNETDSFTLDTSNGDITRGGTCEEDWSCGSWGSWNSCSGGTQSRTKTCTDANNCGTTATKPSTSESRNCSDITQPSCTENWSCGAYGSWSNWSTCAENGTQTRTRTKTCTDANSCGTTANKPVTTETESQACTYSPTEQKPEYTSHSSTLGSNIMNMSYLSDSKSFDLSATGGQYGYRILNIPSHITVKICVNVSSGSVGYNAYPQYHYGYDWSTPAWEAANPGCITAYNKNDWANGILVHVGDPTPANATGTITVTQVS
ncbi:MAG: thrombospondin type-1 domain-containing protein, partial [archaeon]